MILNYTMLISLSMTLPINNTQESTPPRLETYLFEKIFMALWFRSFIQKKKNYCCDGIDGETKNEFEYQFSWLILCCNRQWSTGGAVQQHIEFFFKKFFKRIKAVLFTKEYNSKQVSSWTIVKEMEYENWTDLQHDFFSQIIFFRK